MKITNNIHSFIFQCILISLLFSCSNIDTEKINHSFKVAINPKQDITNFNQVYFEQFDHLNLGFFRGNLWLKLKITNEKDTNKSYMFVSNDRFSRNYVFYKLDSINNSLKLVTKIKDVSIQDHRTFNNANPNLKIDLAPNEQATYIITTASDGRTKDATPKVISIESYFNKLNKNVIWNIVFYGVIGFLLIINIYQWSIYKQKIYCYYIFYIISTLLVYLGIEGYFFNLKLNHLLIDHFIFVSVKLWALSLILYTSKFLDIKLVAPNFYRFIKLVLATVLGGTLLYQFIFYKSSIQYLHYFENILSSLWLLLIIGIILLSAKTKKLELKYYLIPLACFILFTIIGLINVHFHILPGNSFSYVKLGAVAEFIGFTYFMSILIKKKLQKTDFIEKELEKNKKQLKTVSEELEEKNVLLSKKTDLVSIFSLIENTLSTESEWNEFKAKIKELTPSFLDQLLITHPDLSKSEIRLLTLIKIGYSQKEIANILSIAPDSVKRARNRVRKKLNITETLNVNEYLKNLH
ncbi:LuxR C-terminal-related transcriptional regulator [Flavobacteriaceae bacterium]|nr:LuxR C-terminal-related transcriptional regulator [Flavobacteriaceae bacterium]